MKEEKIRHYIKIDPQAFFVADQSAPEHNRYVFGYTIRILNEGVVPARLLARHWIITDGEGRVQEVRGDGVVGEQPYLRPGEAFQYTSGAVLETPIGSMQGSYQMITDEGEQFDAPIPAFVLAGPRILH